MPDGNLLGMRPPGAELPGEVSPRASTELLGGLDYEEQEKLVFVDQFVGQFRF
jgi:hypothetical protein